MPNVERNIYFYRINTPCDTTGAPFPFDVKDVVAKLHALPQEGGNRRMSEGDDADITCDVPDPTKTAIRFARCRMNGLPQVEEAGAVTALDIAPKAGLFEATHMVFFDNNVVGAEFNFHGPRVTKFPEYLRYALPALHNGMAVIVEALLKDDPKKQLENLESIKVLDFSVRASHLGHVKEADATLYRSLKAAADFGKAEQVEMVIRAGRSKDASLLARVKDVILSLVKSADPEESKIIVTGKNKVTKKTDVIDVLSEKLIARRSMLCVDARSRAVDSASAFHQIRTAYADLKPAILLASGIEEE